MNLGPTLLTGAGMILNFLVLPTLLNKDAAIPRTQSFPTALALGIMTIGYIFTNNIFPALATSIGVFLWIAVGLYRYPSDDNSKS